MAKQRNPGGGGFTKRVEKPVRYGPSSTNVISRDAVMHIGQQRGTHVTGQGDLKRPNYPLVERKAFDQPQGNALATNVGKGGPGAGRTIYKTGSQSQWGKPNPGSSPTPRDTLAEYGPEVSNPGSTLKR